jgi:NADH:ubiquinone oxidoreductase subunit E
MMISDWGAEGYGIYWILMEALKRNGFYDLENAHIIAREYYTTEAKIKCIASQYKLFGMSDDGKTINGVAA